MIVIIIFQHTHAIQEPNCESIANDWATILRGFPAKWIIDRITICRQAIKNAVIWEFMWEVLNHILHVNVPINIRLQRAVLSRNYVSFCGIDFLWQLGFQSALCLQVSYLKVS